MSWTVYILRCGDNTLYTGVTNDLAQRLIKHKNGTGAKYTRGREPFEVVLSEPHATKSDALKREAYIKGLTRAQKQGLFGS